MNAYIYFRIFGESSGVNRNFYSQNFVTISMSAVSYYVQGGQSQSDDGSNKLYFRGAF